MVFTSTTNNNYTMTIQQQQQQSENRYNNDRNINNNSTGGSSSSPSSTSASFSSLVDRFHQQRQQRYQHRDNNNNNTTTTQQQHTNHNRIITPTNNSNRNNNNNIHTSPDRNNNNNNNNPFRKQNIRKSSQEVTMMGMSSIHGISSTVSNNICSPPESPAAAALQQPAIHAGPLSPSRSWDEGEQRPPSPGHSWKLQPRPRIVAELGAFGGTTVLSSSTSGGGVISSSTSKSTSSLPSYPFHRTQSMPISTSNSNNSNNELYKHRSSAEGAEDMLLRPYDRPPTPTRLSQQLQMIQNSSSSSSGDEAIIPSSSSFDDQHQHHNHRNRSNENSPASSVSSGGGGVGQSSQNSLSVQRITAALQQNGPRPSGLSMEEKVLWDTIQNCRKNVNNSSKQQNQNQISSFTDIQQKAIVQQQDNIRSLKNMQKLLADVQKERDQAISQLQDYQTTSGSTTASVTSSSCCGNSQSSSINSTSSFVEEKETMQKDLKAMAERIVALEKELEQQQKIQQPQLSPSSSSSSNNAACTDASEHKEEEEAEAEADFTVTVETTQCDDEYALPTLQDADAKEIIDQLEREKESLLQELEWKNKEIYQLEQQIIDNDNTGASIVTSAAVAIDPDIEALKKDLAEKTSALENAKMIIASLENASGSRTTDLRTKLRQRDEEVSRLQKDNAQKKKRLDILAMELRDLQKDIPPERFNTQEHKKRLLLSKRLQDNLTKIQASAVVLESTQDPAAVCTLSALLADCSNILHDGIHVIEHGKVDNNERTKDTSTIRLLRKDVEDKSKIIKRLEEALRRQNDEAKRYKTKYDESHRKHDEEIHTLRAEIKILRQQCNTNMEVLTKKERELAVLRDSLRVEDDVGYISDDDDEEEPTGTQPTRTDSNTLSTFDYGPSQAEALATLLAHGGGGGGGNRSFDSASVVRQQPSEEQNKKYEAIKTELGKARNELEKARRELKVEKESLSNAKMIISSLERANKSMMEDLRARLQDSNTAIASLLEKSLESEKTSAKLRAELEELKNNNTKNYNNSNNNNNMTMTNHYHNHHNEHYERHHNNNNVIDEDTTLLALPPPPAPLLLTETID